MKYKYLFLILFFIKLFFVQTYADVLFSEIFPNTSDDARLEYIELYNSSSIPMSLSGYTLKDKSGKQFIFGNSEVLVSDEKRKYYRNKTKIILNNKNEEIFLYDKNGILSDNFKFTESLKGVKFSISENRLNNFKREINLLKTTVHIDKPDIIIDSGINTNFECNNKKNCSVNFRYMKKSNFEKCKWDFGGGIYNLGDTSKCDPGYVNFGVGNFRVKLIVFERGDYNNFSINEITFSNNIENKFIKDTNYFEKKYSHIFKKISKIIDLKYSEKKKQKLKNNLAKFVKTENNKFKNDEKLNYLVKKIYEYLVELD